MEMHNLLLHVVLDIHGHDFSALKLPSEVCMDIDKGNVTASYHDRPWLFGSGSFFSDYPSITDPKCGATGFAYVQS